MKFLRLSVALTVAVLLLSGCVTGEQKLVEAGYQPLGESELASWVSGNTLYGRYVKTGVSWSEYMSSEGTTDYKDKDYPDGNPGTWYVENGAICWAYANINAGLPFCDHVYFVDGLYEMFSARGNNKGQPTSIVLKIEGGNTH